MPFETLEEIDTEDVSSHVEWVGMYLSTLGVVLKGGRYEYEGVPASVWRDLVRHHQGALRLKTSGQWHDVKPPGTSLGTYYHQSIEHAFPGWRVENPSGQCVPANDLALDWEARRGPRGTTRLHLYLKDGVYRRHGHYGR